MWNAEAAAAAASKHKWEEKLNATEINNEELDVLLIGIAGTWGQRVFCPARPGGATLLCYDANAC